MAEIFWTADRISELRVLWARGDTCSEIGNAMGTTRNAVISKVHRLELSGRQPTRHPVQNLVAAKAAKAKNAERVRRQRSGRTGKIAFFVGERTPPLEIVDRPVQIESLSLPFGDLRPFSGSAVNQCRYIASEPAGPEYVTCGKPTSLGESWCAACKRIVFNYQPSNVVPLRRQARAA